MGYIGKPPEQGRYGKLDQISSGFNGSTATFNLTVGSEAVYPVNPQALIISLNGVIQQPGTDYTVSSATITFTTNPASGVGFFGVILGDALDIGTPSDGSVTVAKMAANSVDSAQYVDGSIDRVHLVADIIDGTKIADDVINSEHYAAASIDNEHLADNAVNSAELAAGSVDTAHIAASQITNALMADDAIGVAELSATGTASSSTFLRGDNAWAAAGGGNLVLIDTATASSSSALLVYGLNSSIYQSYLVVASYIRPSADGPVLQLRFGDGGSEGSPGIDSGGSDYVFHVGVVGSHSASYSGSVATQSRIQLSNAGTDNAVNSSFGMEGWLHFNGSVQPLISGTTVYVNSDNSSLVYGGHFIGKRQATMAVTAVELSPSTGTFTSGRLTVWGLKHD